MRRAPFFCDRCGDLVRSPEDRVIESSDFMRGDNRKRLRRVFRQRLCFSCMETRLQELGA